MNRHDADGVAARAHERSELGPRSRTPMRHIDKASKVIAHRKECVTVERLIIVDKIAHALDVRKNRATFDTTRSQRDSPAGELDCLA